jgi:hypothetical protein
MLTFKCWQTKTLNENASGLIELDPPVDFTDCAMISSNGDLYITTGENEYLVQVSRDFFELEFNVE